MQVPENKCQVWKEIFLFPLQKCSHICSIFPLCVILCSDFPLMAMFRLRFPCVPWPDCNLTNKPCLYSANTLLTSNQHHISHQQLQFYKEEGKKRPLNKFYWFLFSFPTHETYHSVSGRNSIAQWHLLSCWFYCFAASSQPGWRLCSTQQKNLAEHVHFKGLSHLKRSKA